MDLAALLELLAIMLIIVLVVPIVHATGVKSGENLGSP
jgi:hypothetical protein